MKLLIQFGFGIEFRGDGSAILGHEQADGIAEICMRATDLFGGYTKYNTEGARRDPDSNLVIEEAGCTISVLTGHNQNNLEGRIGAIVEHIKASLHQKAVAVTRTEVQFDIL